MTDTNGQQASESVVIVPEKVIVSFATEPVGLSVTFDGGTPRVAPFDYDTLVGFNHTINAADQSMGQNGYTFASWSDGGAQQHTLVVPASGASLTATFTANENTLPAPSPVISRNVPVFASGQAYPASLANDADYTTEWRSTGAIAWIAYDLSGVPTAQRQEILVAWHNNSGANYDFSVIPTESNLVPVRYMIEGHTVSRWRRRAQFRVGHAGDVSQSAELPQQSALHLELWWLQLAALQNDGRKPGQQPIERRCLDQPRRTRRPPRPAG